MGGLSVILLAFLISITGYMISPDNTPNANTQILEIALEKPGFSCDFLKVRRNEQPDPPGFLETIIAGRPAEHRYVPFLSMRMEGDRVVVREYSPYSDDRFYSEFRLVDILYPVGRSGYTYDKNREEVRAHLMDGREVEVDIGTLRERVRDEHVVKKRFLLGTDRFGRDMLSRLILGTRVSLSVGFVAVSISLLVGLLLGGIAGYFRGWIDRAIMWLVNVVWSVPTLLMVIAITLVLGKGYWQVFVAVGMTMWVEVARVVRGQVLGLREKEFIESARAMGMRSSGIIFRHIIPNTFSPVIIISAANFATAILLEAGLSFLGIGVQPPVPTWGGMVKEHYGYIIVDQGYLAFIPGLAIMLMVLSFTLVGNGLRDAMDTRAR